MKKQGFLLGCRSEKKGSLFALLATVLILFTVFCGGTALPVYGAEALTLANGDKTDYVIVLPKEATPVQKTAAETLSATIREISGVTIPIQSESDTAINATSKALVIGPSETAQKLLGNSVKETNYGYDAVLIRQVGNAVVFSGHPVRGPLYAVNTFLEDALGCRWWTTKESTIPKMNPVKAENFDYFYTPALICRESFYKGVIGTENVDFAVKLKCNGGSEPIPEEFGGHHSYLHFVHSFYQLIKPEEYFEEHPDWFPEIDGIRKVCYPGWAGQSQAYRDFEARLKPEQIHTTGTQFCLSNEGLFQEMLKKVLEELKKRPNVTIVSISQNDWDGHCECAECSRIAEEEGSQSGPLLRFVNRMADEIKKYYPNIYVDTLAYQYTRKPPKITKARDNVIVRLCSIECSFIEPLGRGEQNKEFREDMEGWSQKADHIFIWDYVTNFSLYFLPFPNYRVWKDNINFYVDHNAVGLFEQGDYQTPTGDFVQMRAWVMAKLLWDPKADQDALMREFIAGYYAPEIVPYYMDYFNLLADAYEASGLPMGIYKKSVTDWMDLATINKATELLNKVDEIAKDLEKKDPEKYAGLVFKVRRERAPLDLVWLMSYEHYLDLARFESAPFLGPADPKAAALDLFARLDACGVVKESESQSPEGYQKFRDDLVNKDYPSLDILKRPALEESFRTAPTILPGDSIPLKSMPLWHTNDLLSDESIQEMVEKGKESGFAGYTFLPLDSTRPKYLTEDYLKQFGKFLEVTKQNDLKAIFYDDVGFPSGTAGGKIKKEFPADATKRLDCFDWDVTGPSDFYAQSPVPLTDKVLFDKNGGVLQAAVAMNLETFERINIKDFVNAEGEINWKVPEGKWKVCLFVCVDDPFGFVDYLSPDSVRNFLTLTYDQFYSRYKEDFGVGKTIPMVFFDDITSQGAEGGRNWTLGFNEKYKSLFGEDPDLDYPALFYAIGDDTPVARYRMWTTRAELFADGYPKVVHDWCAERGVLSSGHPQGAYTIQPLDMNNDPMLFYRSSDTVLYDSIHYYGHGRDGFKIPTSAAFDYDKDLCVAEIYGDFRNDTFDSKMMFRAAMEIFARGTNVLLPHGTWSKPSGCYIYPEISWRNPAVADCLPQYGDWVSRTSLLLRDSRHVADIAILYPIASLRAGFHFQYGFLTGYPEKGDYPNGLFVPEETDYLAVGSDLSTRIYRDFTFIHPNVLGSGCSIKKKGDETILRLDNYKNWEEYKVFVLTGADMIRWEDMEKILEFYRAGGKVLATTHLPSRSTDGHCDQQVCDAVEEIFGINPANQAPNAALRTGQEDIVLPESFRKVREINKAGFYRREAKNPILYLDPIYRDRAIFLPRPTTEALKKAINTLLPVPDLDLLPVDGKELPVLNVTPRWTYPEDGMIQYIHKVKAGRDVYYLANSSNTDTEFDLQLRGEFKKLEIWNPLTGQIDEIPAEKISARQINGETVTVTRIALASIESLFVVGEKK